MGGIVSIAADLVWEHFGLLVSIITACTIAFWSFVLWRSQITPKRRGICITYGNGIEVRWFTKLVNYVGTKYMVFFGRYIVYFDNKSWERVLDIPGEVELLKGDWGGGVKSDLENVTNEFLVEQNKLMLKRFADAMNQENQLFCPLGRIVLNFAKKGDFKNRRGWLEYCKKYPLDKKAVDDNNGLIVIAGLHRTGSTLLQNLLALDPNCRTIHGWEMLKCPPPPTAETLHTDPRIAAFNRELDILESFCPGSHEALNSVHRFDPSDPEEDCLLLNQLGLTWWWLWWMNNKEWNEFMCQSYELHSYGCRYLHMCMKVLGTHFQGKHWMTKNPNHIQYLLRLLNEFPKANVIITHRDPAKVVPSWSKILIYSHHQLIHNDAMDPDAIPALTTDGLGKCLLEHFSYASKKLVQDRAFLEKEEPEVAAKQFFDVSFTKLTSNPIGVVKDIYEKFGYVYSQEFEEAMEKYLDERPKTGVKYSLEGIGLTNEDIEEGFADYIGNYKQFF